MPQAIPFALAYVASNTAAAVGASVATQAAVAAAAATTVASTVATTAITVGASYALAKLTAPPVPKPSNGQLEFRQSMPARFFTYGPVRTSGPVLLLETGTVGPGNTLVKIVAFGSRRLASIQKFYLDGLEVELDEDLHHEPIRDVEGSHGQLTAHLGEDSQVADPDLMAVYSGWTSAHRLRGIPYAYEELYSGDPTTFQTAFPNGDPTMEIVGGVAVYDPRKDSTNGGSGSHRRLDPSTWEYSDNQRLCALDWLTWQDGYAKAWSRIDWASWVPQIALADQNVPLKAGGSEKRYRVATRVGLDEPRSRVLHRIMQAGDQQLYVTRDGLIGSRGGEWNLATVSLEAETNFVEAFFQHGVPMMERINEFALTAMLPERDYTEFELEPFVLAGDPEHAAGIIRRAPLELTQVPSNSQAQRLAKIYMAKRNPKWSGQVRTNFAGLDAIGEDKVALSFAELDLDGPFWINGQISFLADKTGLTFPVASADPASYAWTTAEEKPAPAAPPEEAVLLPARAEAA
jgi:hypothetical protein